MNKQISVAEALTKIRQGHSVGDYTIDFDHIKVEALDVIKLTKAGIIVPEASIFYDDEATTADEDFDGDWTLTQADTTPDKNALGIKVSVPQHIREWLAKQELSLDKLVEDLVQNYYSDRTTKRR